MILTHLFHRFGKHICERTDACMRFNVLHEYVRMKNVKLQKDS